MGETYPGRSSHLVARLLLMIGMICAVIAQLIGLNVQLALQSDQRGHMKDLQQRLYKQTVVALTSQKLAGNLDELIPWPAKDDARGSGIRSERSEKRPKSAENSSTNDIPRDAQSLEAKALDERRTSDIPRGAQSLEAKALDERRKLDIQQVVHRKSHVPLNEDGQIDWNQIDHVYYYHTRKAGGTTLVQWVRSVAWKHNKTFSKDEGPVFDHEQWENDNRTVLFVTSLRPPVDRVISSYIFDLNQVGVDKTVTEFADDCERYNTKAKKYYFDLEMKKRRGWIWTCASECYGKWFGTWPTPSLKANTEKASETLNNYELIWMKNLRNAEYMKWLLHRFNATDTPIKTKRTTNLPKPNLTQAELTHLDDINQWDAFMYETLRKKWDGIVNLNGTLI